MRRRLFVAALVYLPVNAVLFGLKIVPILTIPALTPHAETLIPIATVTTFVLAIPIAWYIAPYLQSQAFSGMRRKAGVRFSKGEKPDTVPAEKGAEEVGVDQIGGGKDAITPQRKT